jgi:hypothetical protein
VPEIISRLHCIYFSEKHPTRLKLFLNFLPILSVWGAVWKRPFGKPKKQNWR